MIIQKAITSLNVLTIEKPKALDFQIKTTDYYFSTIEVRLFYQIDF
jgi:hypothetical protein